MRFPVDRRHASFAVLVAFFGCASEGADGPDAGPFDSGPSADAGVPDSSAPRFGVLEDPRTSEGAALWLEGELEGDQATVRVRARGLGEVFGFAVDVAFDSQAASLDDASVREGVLGSEAIAMTSVESGRFHFGATRRSPAVGLVAIDTSLPLATLELRLSDVDTSRIELRDVVVRGLDGYTVVEVFGATIVSGGAR